jgi:hypothetical protein
LENILFGGTRALVYLAPNAIELGS